MKHIVVISTRKGPVILWNSTEPCPWNLRHVIRDYNWRARGLHSLANKYAAR